MHGRRWLITVLAIVALGAGSVIGVNAAIDVYGLFRNPRGRHLPVYGDPRVAKYLLNMRYVGENFNAILVGSSMSANWDMKGVQQLRVYNESVNGGNAVEQKAIVDALLEHSSVAVAFVVIHPYLTNSQEFATTRLEPSLWTCALGSHNLVEAYKEMGKAAIQPQADFIDDAGTETFGKLPAQLNPDLQRLLRPSAPFEVRPLALAAYRDLVTALRRRQTRIVFIVPPIREDLLRGKSAAFADYAKLVMADGAAADLLIDFTAPEFTAFRENRTNFADGVHLEPQAAKEVVAEINSRTDRWIAQGALPRPAFKEGSSRRP